MARVGDLVCLKSGGLSMTVVDVVDFSKRGHDRYKLGGADAGDLVCAWAEHGEKKRGVFKPETVMIEVQEQLAAEGALGAIQEEALRLMQLDPEEPGTRLALEEGLSLIESIARHGHDVRSDEERRRAQADDE